MIPFIEEIRNSLIESAHVTLLLLSGQPWEAGNFRPVVQLN